MPKQGLSSVGYGFDLRNLLEGRFKDPFKHLTWNTLTKLCFRFLFLQKLIKINLRILLIYLHLETEPSSNFISTNITKTLRQLCIGVLGGIKDLGNFGGFIR